MEQIEFKTKSDRELLILVVQRSNDVVIRLDKLDETVASHSKEIAGLKGKITGSCNSDSKSKKQILKEHWQLPAGLVALASGILFGVGKACGWW